MIRYSVVRVRDERIAAVLVSRKDLVDPRASFLIDDLEVSLSLPVMLVSRDETTWTGARARARFSTEAPLYSLLSNSEVDWREVPGHSTWVDDV